jgi:hypothetical protein
VRAESVADDDRMRLARVKALSVRPEGRRRDHASSTSGSLRMMVPTRAPSWIGSVRSSPSIATFPRSGPRRERIPEGPPEGENFFTQAANDRGEEPAAFVLNRFWVGEGAGDIRISVGQQTDDVPWLSTEMLARFDADTVHLKIFSGDVRRRPASEPVDAAERLGVRLGEGTLTRGIDPRLLSCMGIQKASRETSRWMRKQDLYI